MEPEPRCGGAHATGNAINNRIGMLPIAWPNGVPAMQHVLWRKSWRHLPFNEQWSRAIFPLERSCCSRLRSASAIRVAAQAEWPGGSTRSVRKLCGCGLVPQHQYQGEHETQFEWLSMGAEKAAMCGQPTVRSVRLPRTGALILQVHKISLACMFMPTTILVKLLSKKFKIKFFFQTKTKNPSTFKTYVNVWKRTWILFFFETFILH